MDLSGLDFNSLPVWVITVTIVLYLLPGILERLSTFIPPLASLVKAEQERKDAVLLWRQEANGLRLSSELKGQERLIDILEQSLERMFDDRAASEANYEAVIKELRELRYQVKKMGDMLSLHSSLVSKLTDEHERFSERLGQLPERVDSLKAYVEGVQSG